MLQNYITVALRNIRKYKGYTLINVLGLSTGIACSLLIFLWTADELGVDQFHTKGSRTYWVLRNMHLTEGHVITTLGVPNPVEGVLAGYPEVETITAISWEFEYLFDKNGQPQKEIGRYVSRGFFEVFSYSILAGDRATALNEKLSMALSERLAIKYFGSVENALGQNVRANNTDFKVTAVIENPRRESSLQFDWLIPKEEFVSRNNWVESWSNGSFGIAVCLAEGANAESFEKKIEQEINNHTNHEADERLALQKYSERYLHGTFENGVNTGGRIDYVVMLSIVAVFIIVIACVNFMNLATARSVRRSQEIGLRKVMGAGRLGLSVQFLTESTVMSFMSVFLAVGAAFLALPYFNNLTGKSMAIDLLDPKFLLIATGIAVFTGLLSGSYPALLLPSFKLTNSLKGAIRHTVGAKFFRKGLVVFQFGLSILLIVGTLAVLRQLDFVLTKNLGLNKENLVHLNLQGETQKRFQTYKEELLKIPGVESVTSSSGNPLSYGRSSSSPTWEGKDPAAEVEINILTVGPDFRKTMKTEILTGRDFSDDLSTDSLNYIINEQAARLMGFQDPLGKSLTVWGRPGRIIGVLRSFHMSSLYHPIAPLIVRFDPAGLGTAFVRIHGDLSKTLQSIETMSKSFNPSIPFEYRFLDDEYAADYKSEQMISELVTYFAGLAIFISCLGLLGLSSFSAEERRKELGIRKVHGATSWSLVVLLSRDYGLLIVVSFVLSAPLAWYIADSWLNRFAFRTSIGLTELFVAGIATCLVAGVTVGFKSLQAASMDPVKTLREE